MIAVLPGCGLRRAELSDLRKEYIQIRQGHWAVVGLVGKGNQVWTLPMPIWVKGAADRWLTAASGYDRTSVQGGEPVRNALGTAQFGERYLVHSPELCGASRARPPRHS